MFKALIHFIVIFLALVGAAALALVVYIFVADPLSIKSALLPALTPPVIVSEDTATTTTETTGTEVQEEQGTKNPLLSVEQEQALEKLGVDVTKLPSVISPEMEECFTEALGQERVEEIKSGSSPGAIDFFKARSCL